MGIRAQFDDAKHAFAATASWPIKAGTELLFYYGSLCREAWVNMYGFAPKEAKPCAAPRPPAAPLRAKAAGLYGKPMGKPMGKLPGGKPMGKLPGGKVPNRHLEA